MANNFSKVFSAELDGIEAKLVEVETDLHVGLHSFNIVGLADKALNEAKERVSAALKNIGVKPPNKENRKIIINLAPADLKKTGSHYDLAIALGYLLATKQIKDFDIDKKIFIGELALDGSLRPINGALNIAYLASQLKFEYLFVPQANAQEAALIENIKIIPVKNLGQIISHLEATNLIEPQSLTKLPSILPSINQVKISDIKGQANAKRALLITAAGAHNLLMSGSPGGGKTMLAQALNSLLPPLTTQEVIEITKIYSAAGLLNGQPYINRPFRNPHHNASLASIVGGGINPKPGEVSLAHRGILFLDELPEFHRDALEALRQPLENKTIVISRAKGSLVLPANFTLVAAMNPCPCGWRNDEQKECVCGANTISRYQKKISGPFLDRIDLQINVPRVELEELREKTNKNNEMEASLEKIYLARKNQMARQGKLNSELNSKECEGLIQIEKNAEEFLEKMFKKARLTARGYYRILKVAQTIADLDNAKSVKASYLQEAFSYRLRDN